MSVYSLLLLKLLGQQGLQKLINVQHILFASVNLRLHWLYLQLRKPSRIYPVTEKPTSCKCDGAMHAMVPCLSFHEQHKVDNFDEISIERLFQVTAIFGLWMQCAINNLLVSMILVTAWYKLLLNLKI